MFDDAAGCGGPKSELDGTAAGAAWSVVAGAGVDSTGGPTVDATVAATTGAGFAATLVGAGVFRVETVPNSPPSSSLQSASLSSESDAWRRMSGFANGGACDTACGAGAGVVA